MTLTDSTKSVPPRGDLAISTVTCCEGIGVSSHRRFRFEDENLFSSISVGGGIIQLALRMRGASGSGESSGSINTRILCEISTCPNLSERNRLTWAIVATCYPQKIIPVSLSHVENIHRTRRSYFDDEEKV